MVGASHITFMIRKQREMNAGFLLAPACPLFYPVQKLSPWKRASHTHGGSLFLSQTSLETPPQIHPCLIGGSKPTEVDNEG